MPILYYRILFFCLVPLGLFLLVKGIKLFQRSFAGNLLLEVAFDTTGAPFALTKPGIYAIWIKAPLFKRNPLDRRAPLIFNAATHAAVKLNTSLLAPRVSGFSGGRMELFTFYGEPGAYRLEIIEGSGLSGLQHMIAGALPATNIDLKRFFIQVRESQSQFLALLAIPLMLAGFFGMVGGLVLGLLADQLLK